MFYGFTVRTAKGKNCRIITSIAEPVWPSLNKKVFVYVSAVHYMNI